MPIPVFWPPLAVELPPLPARWISGPRCERVAGGRGWSGGLGPPPAIAREADCAIDGADFCPRAAPQNPVIPAIDTVGETAAIAGDVDRAAGGMDERAI